MIRMTARKPFKYAGRLLSVGEGLSVKGKQEARLLTAMKMAEVAEPVESKPVPFSHLKSTGVVLTEGDSAADLAGKPRPDNPGRSSWAENEEKPKRAYKRRDMAAESKD